jgi:hypothetical protein
LEENLIHTGSDKIYFDKSHQRAIPVNRGKPIVSHQIINKSLPVVEKFEFRKCPIKGIFTTKRKEIVDLCVYGKKKAINQIEVFFALMIRLWRGN